MFIENENANLEPQGTVLPTVDPEEQSSEPEIAPEETEMLDGVVVDCIKLNVRKAPAATAPIICTIPRNAEVVIFEEESTEEFYKVYTASGIEGFCMKQYISIKS